MANWFDRNYNTREQKARYRAMFPIDIFIDDTGDEERNIAQVHSLIKETLDNTPLTNYQLERGDVERFHGRV